MYVLYFLHTVKTVQGHKRVFFLIQTLFYLHQLRTVSRGSISSCIWIKTEYTLEIKN